jgi:hypothetical protein
MVFCVYWFNKTTRGKQVLPNYLTVLGILGTFGGIVVGLFQFDTQNIQESVPGLLSGLKTAFLTSIAGIVLSLIQRFNNYRQLDDSSQDDNPIDNLVKLMEESNLLNKYSNDLLKERLTSIEKSLGGDGDSSLLSQIQKLRMNFQDKQDELIREFKIFAENQADNNSKALIEALNEVMHDFNTKINEQFGDNFKQLNEAVGKLLEWQENYKDQIELMVAELLKVEESLIRNQEIITSISDQYEKSLGVSSQFEVILTEMSSQREVLQQNMEKFSELVDKSSDVFPSIEKNINSLTTSLSDSVNDTISNVNHLIKSQEEQIKSNISTLQESYDTAISRLTSIQTKIAEDLKDRIQSLDKGLEHELNQALSSLGKGLTGLSNKFVADYSELANELERVFKELKNYNSLPE